MSANNTLPPGSPQDWLARARSSYALANAPKSEEIFFEDLCFHAQQAAEKAIKAVLLSRQLSFRYVHDLEELLVTAAKGGVDVPDEVKKAVELTDYAFETRYPGEYEPVSEEEYKEALSLAKRVLEWAEGTMEKPKR